MADRTGWWERVERIQTTQGLSVMQTCKRLGISRRTYYNYRNDPSKHPINREVITAFAKFLDEDVEVLTVELNPHRAARHRAFIEADAARRLGLRLHQEHVQALARVLGMLSAHVDLDTANEHSHQWTPRRRDPQPHGVDVVARLLRCELPMGADRIDALVAVLTKKRGLEWPEPEYQFQIYVLPIGLTDPGNPRPPEEVRDILDRTRTKVDAILSGTMLPVTREHSAELHVGLLQDRSDVLLYPGLLDLRAPDAERENSGRTIIVTGVYYAGAPDVAALLARRFGLGFSTFDEMARLQVSAGLKGLPGDLQRQVTRRIAHEVMSEIEGRTTGAMVWATDDPDAILSMEATELESFSQRGGLFVMLELSDDGLDYAAQGICRVPDESNQDIDHWRGQLTRQQVDLSSILPESTIVHTVELPTGVAKRGEDYPDAVDAMFDRYAEAFQSIAGLLVDR